MIYENWLKTEYLKTPVLTSDSLKENLKTECLVIGAGFAGLHAALRLVEAGKSVVILEKNICGGSSSGQSAGFLTPNSEEDFQQLIYEYGKNKAQTIYQIPSKGAKLIVDTIQKNGFQCDFRKQDSLYFSNKSSHNSQITNESMALAKNRIPHELLNKKELQKLHPGKNYLKGVIYPGCYGINSFAYCQEMKKLLLSKGVKIFENSEVHSLDNNTARTHLGSVTGDNVVVCIDKMKTEVNEDFSKQYYHIQTYLSVSEPLSDAEMKTIFPEKELMCWDTRWQYIHYRPIYGNRIIIGGSSPWAAYLPYLKYSPKIIGSFIKKFKKSFPIIKEVDFNYYWSGMIDVTKDLLPIVDYDKENRSVMYVMGCAGLNWAAYCGDYVARKIIEPEKTEDLSEFFASDRKFLISAGLQKILGKRISFFLSHLYSMLAE